MTAKRRKHCQALASLFTLTLDCEVRKLHNEYYKSFLFGYNVLLVPFIQYCNVKSNSTVYAHETGMTWSRAECWENYYCLALQLVYVYAITITSGVFLVSPIRSGLNFKKALSRALTPCVLFRQVESDLNTGRQTSLSCLYGHLNMGKKKQKQLVLK